MLRAIISLMALPLVSLGLLAGAARAADRVAEFQKARPELQRSLRSRDTAVRIEALQTLQEFAIDDSVRLLHGALSDPEPDVRETAYAALLKMNDNQEVCDTLLALVKQSAKAGDEPVTIAPALAVLMASKLRSTQRDLEELFSGEKNAAGSPELLIYMADQLGQHQKSADVEALANLTRTPLFETHFGVRRAVVGALAQIPSNEAIDALIDLMDRVSGEVHADVVRHVAAVTGQIFGTDAAAWKRWWADARGSFDYPARSPLKPAGEMPTDSEYGRYYGMPLFSERMVFVLDTSGSMSGPRIAAAKRELTNTIEGLSEHAQFSIVVFASTVGVWQRKLMPANARVKQAAIAFVNGQGTGAHTASYDALETAFMFDTEAIYFLSDGAPTSGKIRAPSDIIDAVTNANRTRRISIYTIGVGAGQPGGPLDAFLKTLAEQNMGSYRRVDG